MPPRPLKPSSGGIKGAGVGGIDQFELGFVSNSLLVCLLGRADLGTMSQARWEGLG